MYSVLKQLRRDGRNFLQQHDDWVLRSQVDSSNRAVHEHRLLSRALHYGVSYDQMCMPNLASMEVLVRRRMLIERAHAGGKGALPVYEGSEHFMGLREAADGSVVDPAAVRYTAEKLHMESEVLKQQRLSMQEKRAWGLPSGGRPSPPVGAEDDDGAPVTPAEAARTAEAAVERNLLLTRVRCVAYAALFSPRGGEASPGVRQHVARLWPSR